MSIYSLQLSIDDLLKPALDRIKDTLHKDLEKRALEIVTEEVTKYSIDVSRLISIKDLGPTIQITIHKEVK